MRAGALLACALAVQPVASLHFSPFIVNKEDVLAGHPTLKAALRAWWGDDAYNVSNRAMQFDLMRRGYEARDETVEDIAAALQLVVDRRAAAEPCSELPSAVALHAWRYDREALLVCLGLGKADPAAAAGGCRLPCTELPSVEARLSCGAPSAAQPPEPLRRLLAGMPPEGECRHERDHELVETSGGTLRGMVRPVPFRQPGGNVTIKRTRAFFAVPYAEPPGRFDPPRPLKRRWAGVLNTTDNYAPGAAIRTRCAGLAPLDGGHGSEDCLYLDLYTPPADPYGALAPIFVFLYGAGFSGGDAWQDGLYDGARFTVRNGVILVIVSYRVGFLGHWAHPALAEESGDGSVGNYGELDQRMALRWLQENARAFGGDPSRVTIIGHSSGAIDVNFHLLSPASQGLFSRAIVESGNFEGGWFYQEKSAAFAFYETMGEVLGCPRDQPGAAASAQLACLRQLPMQAFSNLTGQQALELERRILPKSTAGRIWDVAEAVFLGVLSRLGLDLPVGRTGLQEGDSLINTTPLWPVLPVGVVVDGSEAGLPAAPAELFKAGRINDAQVWINHEADEGTVFSAGLLALYPWYRKPELSHSAVDAIIAWATGQVDAVRQFYPPHGPDTAWPFARLSKVVGDGVFVCSTRRAAKTLAKRRNGTVFYGELTYVGSQVPERRALPALLHLDLVYFLGAHHNEQPRWIFGPNGAFSQWNASDQRMHEVMNCHYARMAHCGDPGAGPMSGCLQRLANAGRELLSCEALRQTEAFPAFPAFEPSRVQRTELHPNRSGLIAPEALEDQRCAFWDAAPPFALPENNCRGCAQRPSLLVA